MNWVTFLIRTQVMAITLAVLRIIYLNVLAFFDQPERALQYINWYVYGLAILVGILAFFLTRYFIGRSWLAVLLVLFSYLIIYQPILLSMQEALLGNTTGYYGIINFLAISTGLIYLVITAFGMVLGFWFGTVNRD
ncbi:hypothetical protein BIV60_20750 [Bacillus sp. MUM 116]|uniref:hypothetical protein n=1 Tax=Bacillus sp. MUM 116 TaxID=1678002 RepID=UPI0008F56C3F|nr:hypothetical protein [Bacillus sp. MUM 116]OIK10528.1 hypothetical protein BIV60_20750 [Bacillus sp. MUM 116]